MYINHVINAETLHLIIIAVIKSQAYYMEV